MANTETLTRCPKCGSRNAQLRERCKACGTVLHGADVALFETTEAPAAQAIVPRSDVQTDDGLTADALKPGDLVKGTYKLLERIGEGGAGTVFVGEHTELGNLVAIKALFGRYVRHDDMRRRFIEEGIIQANLSHRNIIRVTDIVQEENLCAIIMEYVEGRSLDRLIRKSGSNPDIEAMTRLFIEMLDGVGYAHDQGIVHRDLKPDNVLLARDGTSWTPKVSDFGIAKIVSDAKRTETGTTMGTVHYAAPEQLTNAKSVDGRADIYALGCTFFEMLTGEVPFDGESVYQIMRAHIEAPRPDASALNPDVPRALSLAIKRAMSVDPDRRFTTCRAFAAEILSAVDRRTASALSALDANALSGPRPALTLGLKPSTSAAPQGSNLTGQNPPSVAGRARSPDRSSSGHNPAAPGNQGRTATGVIADEAGGPTTAGRVVKVMIAVLSIGIVALVIAVAGGDHDAGSPNDPPGPTTTPVFDNDDDAADGDAESTLAHDPNTDADALEIEPANRIAACRSLSRRHQSFDLLGNVPIDTAIAELEDEHASCLTDLLNLSNGTRYEILRAHLTADAMRFTMHSLRALRASVAGGDPCTDVVMASTETQRSLRRLHDAESAGALLDWEIQSLSEDQDAAWTLLSGLVTQYPDCRVPEIPDDLVPEHLRATDAVNPQVGQVRVVGDGSGDRGDGEVAGEDAR